ncbi:MAG: hypothetical protein Ta2A_01380 [Treponemataceae bacterium]|nr:MAG: hypothetical protein Ta2A_01380 [Treponemataceae bacterium]
MNYGKHNAGKTAWLQKKLRGLWLPAGAFACLLVVAIAEGSACWLWLSRRVLHAGCAWLHALLRSRAVFCAAGSGWRGKLDASVAWRSARHFPPARRL